MNHSSLEVTDRVVLPGWRDLTSLFANACDDLPLGQMVHVPGYTMLDTMGSIEVRAFAPLWVLLISPLNCRLWSRAPIMA